MTEFLIWGALIWIGMELNDIGSLLRRRFNRDMNIEFDEYRDERLSFKPKRLRK